MPIRLRAGAWVSPDLVMASGVRRRWRGLRPRPADRALVLRSRSVHSFGMRESLWAVVVGGAGTVLEIRWLPPGRVLLVRSPAWILELAASGPPPPLGATISARSAKREARSAKRVTDNG